MSTHDDTVTIRRAAPSDAPALRRLALLDGVPRPLGGPVLVAEAGGVPRAALALADGRAVADPFHPTAQLVDLLRTRAALLTETGRHGLRALPGRGRRAPSLHRSRDRLRQATLLGRVRLVMQPTDGRSSR
jgi:hypothetical protein